MLQKTKGNALLSSVNVLLKLSAIFLDHAERYSNLEETKATLQSALGQVKDEMIKLEIKTENDSGTGAVLNQLSLAIFMLKDEVALPNKQYMADKVHTLVETLGMTIEGELKGRVLYYVDSRNAKRIELGEQEFGDLADLPSARFDLGEAVKSFAFDRHTACVFHLMRAMEHVVITIAPKLDANVKDRHGKFIGWGKAIANIRQKAEALPANAPQRERWLLRASLLYAVKERWRNDTMHIHAKYSKQDALEVLEATKLFLNCLTEQES